jgi:hypothetical protein
MGNWVPFIHLMNTFVVHDLPEYDGRPVRETHQRAF